MAERFAAQGRWNHNTHYHRFVLKAVPDRARMALDVGTGDGLLAAELREMVPQVTGLDVDSDVLDRGRASGADVSWAVGNVMSAELPEGHFDVVASIATVHHLPDLAAAFEQLAVLTAPGGVLVVIGCARSASPSDYLMDGLGAIQHQLLSRTRGYWQHTAPVEMRFPHTYAEVRDIAEARLPGFSWRRLPLFRYAVVWRRTE
ncbi:Methyltransferase domain-containing protein [Brevibacterium sandarakinum]|uniref:Methyltransferase domain-containing protein n=1 Tax=Brevibacterium sandarakinum TaxID=629680 RepID=A0A1H1XEG2_BRESA|nr:class I SAM-dependent methyltransferase [Brevibacterium sandarakinum]SDT07530.1 Methyltransferase domain-containing protein [Brevibacterium sandarakinum]